MTSKRCFFNGFFFRVMKEDLRHRVWVAALSVLGSFLTVLVVWLLWWSNRIGAMDADGFLSDAEKLRGIEGTVNFFGQYLGLLGGALAIAGALVAGVTGFRYLFHKNMVDSYHSLPVKRDVLFAAYFLDGFLIWIVPLLAFFVPVTALAGGFIRQLGGTGADIGEMARMALLSLLTLIVVFLLAYSFVIVAVMLSGNELNALLCMVVAGFGAVSLSGLAYIFFVVYMDCFYNVWNYEAAIHASPLFAALSLLYWRMNAEASVGAFCGRLSLDFLLAALLFGCGLLLYRRRPSELSEQGVKNRPAAALMRLAAGIAAGMCGWLVMRALTDAAVWPLAWGIFGAVFAGSLCFGAMNVIFYMDFKAFFRHKRQLAGVLAAALLICFSLQWDWFGYDAYLPAAEDIAEAGVVTNRFSNRYLVRELEGYPLEEMHFQDRDLIHAYLEQAVQVPEKEVEWIESQICVGTATFVDTKVTLRSGRSYYRQYAIYEEELESLWAIVSSEEYLKHAFVVSDGMLEGCENFTLRTGDTEEVYSLKSFSREAFVGIIHAYNQDVLGDPEGAFLGRGRRLAALRFNGKEGGRSFEIQVNVYETMERTMAALATAGLEKWVTPPEAEEIGSICFKLPTYDNATPEERIQRVRDLYGVPEPAGEGAGAGTPVADRAAELAEIAEMAQDAGIPELAEAVSDLAAGFTVRVTDPAEIAELYPFLSYVPAENEALFQKGYVEISYTDLEGRRNTCYFPEGALPEKYILRFGGVQ